MIHSTVENMSPPSHEYEVVACILKNINIAGQTIFRLDLKALVNTKKIKNEQNGKE